MRHRERGAAHVSIGFPGLLALLFIALKLTGHLDWPWIWVLAPLWLPAAIGIAIVGGMLGFAGMCYLAAAAWIWWDEWRS